MQSAVSLLSPFSLSLYSCALFLFIQKSDFNTKKVVAHIMMIPGGNTELNAEFILWFYDQFVYLSYAIAYGIMCMYIFDPFKCKQKTIAP